MALPRTFATLGILLGATMMGLVFGLSYFSLFALVRCVPWLVLVLCFSSEALSRC